MDYIHQALAGQGMERKGIVSPVRTPRWKIEIAALIRKTSGAPYRWIAEHFCLDRPASLRAAVCWRDRR